jgi:hypothetical protein
MSEDVKQIRKKMRIHEVLTTVAEKLEPYFKEMISRSNRGNEPQHITILDIEEKLLTISRSKIYDVEYQLHTDLGKFNIKVLIKFCGDSEKFQQELSNYSTLSRKLLTTDLISTPRVIYHSERLNCVIYEGANGVSYKELEIERDIKAFISGRLLAKIHKIGQFNSQMEISYYRDLLLFSLTRIPISAGRQERVIDKMLPALIAVRSSISSVEVLGDFLPASLIINIDSKTLSNIRNEMSSPKMSFSAEIINTAGLSFEWRDRFECMGTFFAEQLIKEYDEKKKYSQTCADFAALAIGYDLQLSIENSKFSLLGLYPQGLTIDFHVALYLIVGMASLGGQDSNDKIQEIITDRFELIEILLNHKPFEATYRKAIQL